MGFFDKIFGKKQQQESIDQGLQKTREGFLGKISRAIAGKSTVDEEVLDQVEDALVTADIGVETTVKIIDFISWVWRGRNKGFCFSVVKSCSARSSSHKLDCSGRPGSLCIRFFSFNDDSVITAGSGLV